MLSFCDTSSIDSNDIEGWTYPRRAPQSFSWSWRAVVRTFGLPCLVGVAAIDPGNFEVDLQAGGAFGVHLIWVLFLASILGCLLQTFAAHVSICTGSHLAELCRQVYDRDPLLRYSIFFITELAIIAFDIAEVVGTAFALQLLFHLPLWLGMILSALDTMLVLFLQRRGMGKIELIVEGLLFILAVCLFYELILSKPSIPEVIQGTFVPTFGGNTKEGIILAISMMGSVVMSHNLFLHSWLEKNRDGYTSSTSTNTPTSRAVLFRNMFSRSDIPIACNYALKESSAIFLATFLINACVIVIATSIPADAVPSWADFGLKDAGALLERTFGRRHTSTIWGIALLASGHAATVTGALASQAVCEGFLDVSADYSGAVVMGTRVLAIVPALVAALIVGEGGADRLIVLSQAILSVALPFAAVPLFKILEALSRSSAKYNRKVLWVGYIVFSVLMIADIYGIYEVGRIVRTDYSPLSAILFLMGITFCVVILIRLLATPVYVPDMLSILDQVEFLLRLDALNSAQESYGAT